MINDTLIRGSNRIMEKSSLVLAKRPNLEAMFVFILCV